jgi:hypothetical protein
VSAGIEVELAEEALIKRVLGLADEGAYLGKLRWHGLRVYLKVEEILKRHISILAKTGSGKSYLTGVLVEELLKNNVPVVIIDPHDEYRSLARPNISEEPKVFERFEVTPKGYGDKVIEYSLDTTLHRNTLPLRFALHSLTYREIAALAGIKYPKDVGALRKAIANLTPYYTIEELKEELGKLPRTDNVLARVEYLEATRAFGDDGLNIKRLVSPGNAAIINLRGAAPEVQEIVVAVLAHQLFELRKLNRIPAHVLVVEEAHNFCPQNRTAHSSRVLRTIASEGRKFGMGICVVSQRPAVVDKNVLSQCGIQIILKITNPNDLKTIIASVEGLTPRAYEDLQRLPIGVCILVGGGISIPVLVDVRVRETKHGVEDYERIEPRKKTFWEKIIDEIT